MNQRREVVWVVEDNDLYRETIRDLIDGDDAFSCPVAVSTVEAAVSALRGGAPPEIVLMDIGLPGMSGVEGARKIRSLSPTTRVVMLTVHEDRDTVFDAIAAGASGYLLKSSSGPRLLQALRAVQDGGAPLNPQIAQKILARFSGAGPGREEYDLTPREHEILQLMVEGITMQEIAERLGVSYHTIDTHIRNIYAKLHVRTRGGAVAKALTERLVWPETPDG